MSPTLGPQYHGQGTTRSAQKTPEPEEEDQPQGIPDEEPEPFEEPDEPFDDDTPAEEPTRRKPTPDVEYGSEDDPPI
jgi:hypothetical protein